MNLFRKQLIFNSTKPATAPRVSFQRDFVLRLMVAFCAVCVLFCCLFARFYYLQVIKHNDFKVQSRANSISLIPTPPIRGEIIDVNGVVLARNYPAFSLEIVVNQVEGKVEDLIEELKTYVSLSESDLKQFKKLRAESRAYEKVPLKAKLTADEASRLAPMLYRFKGVQINARTFREYPYGKLTAHFLGYIGRISDKDKEQLEKDNRTALYRGTTHIGKSGLEDFYEQQLHGVPGFQEVEKDAAGNVIRVIRQENAQMGQTLRLSMDIRVQQEAARLMNNRRGALVALDPQTGGVLAYVSNPSFDPNLFINGIDSDTWKSLNENWQRPLINRVTQGLYPPGSTFKPFMAMALLESGKITQHSMVPAPGVWKIPGTKHQFRDSVRSGHGVVNLSRAIQVSSDTFFYRLGYELGIEKARPYLAEFGLGKQTGIDLPHEYRGVLPSPEWKEKRFSKLPEKRRRWLPSEMVSVSIGQGYNAYTPLQMAHATAILSNNGVVYRPHLVRELLNYEKQLLTLINPKPERQLTMSSSNFAYVKHAMQRVLQAGGTASSVGAGLSYSMAGKTGTAQVVGIAQNKTYNAAMLAIQKRDHAWFIAFAPVDKPKIAVAVILENAGWGVTAAPVARGLTDFYLLQLNQEPLIQAANNAANNPLMIQSHQKQPENNTVQAAFAAAQKVNTDATASAASYPNLKVQP